MTYTSSIFFLRRMPSEERMKKKGKKSFGLCFLFFSPPLKLSFFSNFSYFRCLFFSSSEVFLLCHVCMCIKGLNVELLSRWFFLLAFFYFYRNVFLVLLLCALKGYIYMCAYPYTCNVNGGMNAFITTEGFLFLFHKKSLLLLPTFHLAIPFH